MTHEGVRLEPLIDGPGRYPRRDGGVVVIREPDEAPQSPYDWRGHFEDVRKRHDYGWHSDGTFIKGATCNGDIVGPRIAPSQPDAEPLTEAELPDDLLARLASNEFATVGSLSDLECEIRAGIGADYYSRTQDCKDADAALAKLVGHARSLIAEIRRLRQGASE